MGHCHTSARLGGADAVFGTPSGARESVAKEFAAAEAELKPGVGARALLFLIRGYQALFSPLMASPCKFYPTCSRYAYEAIELHGAGKGTWLAAKRLMRCRPFSQGGVDFVPERQEHYTEERAGSADSGEAGR
jgi:uncharacterized protein